jgi:phage replication-related protein YjqB (UPF0714/DUF867 family)
MSKRMEYGDFTELSKYQHEFKDYARRLSIRNSNIAIIAPHGGGIEPGTSEIANAIANSTFSFYAFEGIKSRGNSILHITSVYFDEPLCVQLIEKTDTVVAIHGCEGKTESIYIGGLDRDLVLRTSIRLSSQGFIVSTESKEYSGEHAQNICNKGHSGKGMQIEIAEGLRQRMFKGLGRRERKITTSIFDLFVKTTKDVLIAQDNKENPHNHFPDEVRYHG